MQSTTEKTRPEVRKEFKITKTIQLESDDRVQDNSERQKQASKALIAPFVWLVVCGVWVFLSQLSGGMFFDKVIICSIIVSCIVFFKLRDSLANW